MIGVLSHSGRPNSEARVTLSRYMVSRSARSSAYCINGRYEGACRVNFQPSLPSFCAASRAAASRSSCSPATRAGSSITIEYALVASSTFSANFAPSWASSSWIAPKRAFLSGASSAPPRRKSRSAFCTWRLRAGERSAYAAESRKAR